MGKRGALGLGDKDGGKWGALGLGGSERSFFTNPTEKFLVVGQGWLGLWHITPCFLPAVAAACSQRCCWNPRAPLPMWICVQFQAERPSQRVWNQALVTQPTGRLRDAAGLELQPPKPARNRGGAGTASPCRPSRQLQRDRAGVRGTVRGCAGDM